MAVKYTLKEGALILGVKAVPGAKKTGICGEYGGALKVKLQSPPDKGRANDELCAMLAGLAGIRVSAVSVIKGAHSREKTVSLSGCGAETMDKICGGKNG